MSNPNAKYHPIIGLVVTGMMAVQPVLGLVHHVRFKRTGRRGVWSYLHLFNGRIGITLGITNAGLGLWMAREGKGVKIAYIVVAVVMWTMWMTAAAWGEAKRLLRIRFTGSDGRQP